MTSECSFEYVLKPLEEGQYRGYDYMIAEEECSGELLRYVEVNVPMDLRDKNAKFKYCLTAIRAMPVSGTCNSLFMTSIRVDDRFPLEGVRYKARRYHAVVSWSSALFKDNTDIDKVRDSIESFLDAWVKL